MEDAEIMTDTPDDAKRQQIDAMYQKARRSFPDVSEITAEELQALKTRENVVLVDVRSDQEQAVSMIPGAVTSAYFEEHQPDYRGASVAVYCTVGQRSGNYAKTLQAGGWRVFNLKGAILGWTHGAIDVVNTGNRIADIMLAARQRNEICFGVKVTPDNNQRKGEPGTYIIPTKETVFNLHPDDLLITLAVDGT